MKNFDEIIKTKLEQLNVEPSQSTWSSIEAGLSTHSGGNAFKAQLLSGVAASAIIGAALVSLPPIGDDALNLDAEMDIQMNYDSSSEPTEDPKDAVAPFGSIKPQVKHEIVMEKRSAVLSPDQGVELNIKETSSSNKDVSDINADDKSSYQNIASTARVDFEASGIQCVKKNILFKSATSESATITWLFDGFDVAEGSRVTKTFVYYGIHDVRMIATFNDGSQKAIESTIEIFENPSADFTDMISMKSNCLTSYISLSGTGTNQAYKWILNSDTVKEGRSVDLAIGNGLHTIALHTINDAGCVATENRSIKVENEFQLSIPSAFSPTNSDGLNDVWLVPELAQMQSFSLTIKRLTTGSVVFESNEYYEWDGSISGTSERPRSEEAFIYVITATDDCGETIKKTGTITCL